MSKQDVSPQRKLSLMGLLKLLTNAFEDETFTCQACKSNEEVLYLAIEHGPNRGQCFFDSDLGFTFGVSPSWGNIIEGVYDHLHLMNEAQEMLRLEMPDDDPNLFSEANYEKDKGISDDEIQLERMANEGGSE